jgi:hypothetical protein
VHCIKFNVVWLHSGNAMLQHEVQTQNVKMLLQNITNTFTFKLKLLFNLKWDEPYKNNIHITDRTPRNQDFKFIISRSKDGGGNSTKGWRNISKSTEEGCKIIIISIQMVKLIGKAFIILWVTLLNENGLINANAQFIIIDHCLHQGRSEGGNGGGGG